MTMVGDSAPSGLTASFGRFVAAFDAAPPEAMVVARMGVIDAIGVMLAARNEPVVRAACAVALEGAPRGESSVMLSGRYARATDAAFINGVAAHALAMDDVAMGCHPSAMFMAALLAEGQAIGASGADLLRAYVVGYELLAELALREPDPLHVTGWHPTAMLGPVAVAGAVANLKRLTAEQATRAIGMAASMAGGLVANFGTQTKAIHLGRVAGAGILAARLAEQGVTSALDALERPDTGLLCVLSPRGRADADSLFDPARGALRIVSNGLSIKKYPVCYSTHRVVDAAADVAALPGFAVDQVSRVEVFIGKTQAWMANNHEPQNPLQAKYSVEFAISCGLAAGNAGFAQLDQQFIDLPLVRHLMRATTIDLREEPGVDDPVFAASDRVKVYLADGRAFDSGEVRFARGNARLPLSEAAMRAKFVDCAAFGGCSDVASLYERLCRLEQITNLADLPVIGWTP